MRNLRFNILPCQAKTIPKRFSKKIYYFGYNFATGKLKIKLPFALGNVVKNTMVRDSAGSFYRKDFEYRTIRYSECLIFQFLSRNQKTLFFSKTLDSVNANTSYPVVLKSCVPN